MSDGGSPVDISTASAAELVQGQSHIRSIRMWVRYPDQGVGEWTRYEIVQELSLPDISIYLPVLCALAIWSVLMANVLVWYARRGEPCD